MQTNSSEILNNFTTLVLNQSFNQSGEPPLNATLPIRITCQVGSVVPQQPTDLSIFQFFKAPSQPRETTHLELGVKVVFYVLAFLLTVVGNSMAILIICLNKKMRSTTNVLLLNLAVSDLMVAAVCMWVHLGNSITPEWPFGPFVCKVNTFCQVVAVVASVLTLTTISVERFTAIVFPLKGRWTVRTTCVTIVMTWTLAVALASPHLFVRSMFQQRWKDRHEVWCAEAWQQVYKDVHCNTWEPGKVVYYCVESIVMYFVPVLIMLITYSIITLTIVTRKLPGTSISSMLSSQERAKRKVIKMLIAVVVCFVICWTPQQCLLLYDVFRPYDEIPLYINTVKYVALYIAYFNSAVNPILYGGFNENFRRGFRELCFCLVAKMNKVHPEGHVPPGTGRQGQNAAVSGHGTAALDSSRTTALRNLPHTPTESIDVTTSHRFHISEAARTAAVFGDPLHQPSTSTARHSIHSDDTTHIAWQALQ